MSELVEVKTIGEVERIVLASGLWNGATAVEFSDDRETWTEAWAPSDEHKHPEYARVTVYRKGVDHAAPSTIRWAEQYPEASDEWAAKWDRAPMRHFGRTARMVAFRQTFRDLLGDVVIEDEDRSGREAATAAGEPAPRDWAAEIAAATDAATLDEINAAARKARVFTPDAAGTALHRAMRARRAALAADAWAPEAESSATPYDKAKGSALAERPARPAPQDHLPPANRAARRARKKGRR